MMQCTALRAKPWNMETKGMVRRVIVFDQVKKFLGGNLVLDIADLQIPKGSIYGLIGANGAGKSTMMRLISGVYTVDSGLLTVDGENITDNAAVKEKMFFVPDDPYFLPQTTMEEMTEFYQCYYPDFDTVLYEQLMASFELPSKNKISSYSKGMRRQAILLLALASNPKYLLLDESFDGVDPVMRQRLRRVMIDIAADKEITVVISSHNLRELDEFCDRVGVLYHGGLLYDITLDRLKEEVHKYQLAFSEPVAKEAFSRFRLLSCDITGKFVTLVIRGERQVLERKIGDLKPLAVEEFPLSLEEIFIYEMGAKGYDYKDIFA